MTKSTFLNFRMVILGFTNDCLVLDLLDHLKLRDMVWSHVTKDVSCLDLEINLR